MPSEFDITQAAAAVYAESLLQLAEDAGKADEIATQLADLKAFWRDQPDFAAMMSSAAIDDDARRVSIQRAFGAAKVDPLILNLMLVLNDKRRAMIFPTVCDAYRRKLDEQRGRNEVFVTTAAPLDDEHRDRIRTEVKRLTGREAVINEEIDPEVLGGIRIQVSDQLYDMTLRRRLRDLRAGLLASIEGHMRKGVSRFVTEEG